MRNEDVVWKGSYRVKRVINGGICVKVVLGNRKVIKGVFIKGFWENGVRWSLGGDWGWKGLCCLDFDRESGWSWGVICLWEIELDDNLGYYFIFIILVRYIGILY